MNSLKNGLQSIITRINDDSITVYAAQASFYVMIATIPFIMLLLSLAQFIVPISYDEVMSAVYTVLPPMLHKLAAEVIGELYSKSAGSVISISAITALWPASRGVAAVERGVKRVYRSGDAQGLVRSIAGDIVQTALFIGMLLLALVALVFGTSIIKMLELRYLTLMHLFATLQKLTNVMIFAVFCLFFAFVYRSFGGGGRKFKNQLAGAVFSTLGWVVFSFVYSVYIENFSNYSYVYGSLAAIVLMMLWLYSCMIIFLLGAELNVAIAAWRERKGLD